MTTLYRYSMLEETRSENAHVWRGSHITIYCLAAIFGGLSTWWFYKLLLVFGGNCVLNPNTVGFVTYTPDSTNRISSDVDVSVLGGTDVEYWTSSPFAKDPRIAIVALNATARTVPTSVSGMSKIISATPRTNVGGSGVDRVTIVDVLHTSWISEESCEVILYAPVLSVIFGVIWLVFFVMCPPSGEKSITGMEQPWRILIPAGVFSLAMVGYSLHAAWHIQGGLASLCRHFYNATGSYQCTSDIDTLAPSPSRSILGANILITLSVWCIWTCALCWVTCTLLVLARLVLAPDFIVRTVTVRLIEQGDATFRTVNISDCDAETTFTSPALLVKADVAESPSMPSNASTTDNQRQNYFASPSASLIKTLTSRLTLVKSDIAEPSTVSTTDEHSQDYYASPSPSLIKTFPPISTLVKSDIAEPSTTSTTDEQKQSQDENLSPSASLIKFSKHE